MSIEELLEILDMNSVGDIEYSECFCNLMEAEEDIPEEFFYMIVKELSAEDIHIRVREYLSEIISGIADDCIDFYSQLSSYKRNFGGMVNFFTEKGEEERIYDELYQFRKWYNDSSKVKVYDINNDKNMRVSVCEALVLGRMEKLSAGSFDFDFTDAMDLEWVDFEDYVRDDEDEDYENYDYDYRDTEDSDLFFDETSGRGYIQ